MAERAGLARGRSGEVGSLTPGASANLIAVQGDPLASLASFDRVQWVMQGGRVQWPATAEGDQP